MSRSIEAMQGLGPTSARWLGKAGFLSADEIVEVGPVVAYLRVEQTGIRPSKNLLWALVGAVTDRHWTAVSEEEKAEWLAELEAIRGD